MLPSTCILVCHHLVFSEFLCWSFRQSKLRFKLKFIIKWREAGLSRYFSTLEEKFCISVQPRNILYKSESQIKAIVISIGKKMLSFVLFLPFLPLVLLLHPKTQGKKNWHSVVNTLKNTKVPGRGGGGKCTLDFK